MSDKGERCVLGLDFGSDSIRAVVVRVADGAEMAAGVAEYPRWMAGKYCRLVLTRLWKGTPGCLP